MCGIALIISGVRIDLSSLSPESGFHVGSSPPEIEELHNPDLSINDIKAALLRRGPDHLGSKKVILPLKRRIDVEKDEMPSLRNGESVGKKNDFIFVPFEVACTQDDGSIARKSVAELHFIGATLQLRGMSPVLQPLVDTSGNILVYNGEIFGGIYVGRDDNDTETLMHALQRCCSCDWHGHEKSCYCIEKGQNSVPELFSTIKGPWALIYFQANSKTIWFGRDALGRRSLLVHWPTLDDSRLLLSSVSPPLSVEKNSGSTAKSDNKERDVNFQLDDPIGALDYWEELSCGIYSISLVSLKASSPGNTPYLVGGVRKHEWTDPLLKQLINFERTLVEPIPDLRSLPIIGERHADGISAELNVPGIPIIDLINHCTDIPDVLMNSVIQSDSVLTDKGPIRHSVSLPAHKVLTALKESMVRRTGLNTIFQSTVCEAREEKPVPVAVLFSGGLDSMILAALVDQYLNSSYEIDLLNVSFDGQLAPDRISAREGVRELQRIAPSRSWRLVEIDADLSNLTSETKHVMSLINPAKTYMDLNIGLALWLAAGGEGWVDERIFNHTEEDRGHFKYKSEAKILFVGSGADEQCAGYGRHRTKYRLGGWLALQEEMKLDMQRIWKRNLGRDDRCISDNGKEARFPFLDEDVIKALLEIPLWEIADLDQPVGRGDKKILREVARLLGLEAASVLPKRAIQFGSRIARESNRKNFGSNRAANQASAGSVVICGPGT